MIKKKKEERRKSEQEQDICTFLFHNFRGGCLPSGAASPSFCQYQIIPLDNSRTRVL